MFGVFLILVAAVSAQPPAVQYAVFNTRAGVRVTLSDSRSGLDASFLPLLVDSSGGLAVTVTAGIGPSANCSTALRLGSFYAQVPGSDLINGAPGPYMNRSWCMWFFPDDSGSPQPNQVQGLLDEGDLTRGINIFVYGSSLSAGMWNFDPATQASNPGTWASTPISR